MRPTKSDRSTPPNPSVRPDQVWPTRVQSGEIDHGPRARQKVTLAGSVADLLTRNWFEDDIQPPPDHYMTRLLFITYSRWINASPPSVKEACDFVGVGDLKTARKYVAQAQELGLLHGTVSEHDRRVRWVYPTERLREIVDRALLRYFDYLRQLMYGVLGGPLPNTGAPLLFAPDSPELNKLDLKSSVGRGIVHPNETASDRAKRIKERLVLAKKLNLE